MGYTASSPTYKTNYVLYLELEGYKFVMDSYKRLIHYEAQQGQNTLESTNNEGGS